MKRTLFFLLTFILLCSSKCKEDPLPNPDPTPNPTTEEPTDEISCLINGVEWKTGPPFLLSNPLTEVSIVRYDDGNGGYTFTLNVFAKKKNSTVSQRLSFSCPYDTTKLGQFKVGFNEYAYTDYNTESVHYESDTLFNNLIKINSINTQKQSIKGNFNFRAINRKEKDTINITNGKFNCRYQFFK